MKIKTPQKILLGIATIFYVIFPIMIVAFWGPILLNLYLSKAPEPPNPYFAQIFAVSLCLFIPLQLILLLFYVIHASQNKLVSENVRIIFMFSMFLAPFIIYPIYYYRYLWRPR